MNENYSVNLTRKSELEKIMKRNIGAFHEKTLQSATGKLFNTTGEGIIEQALGRALEVSRSDAEMKMGIIDDTNNVLEAAYNAVSNIRDSVFNQLKIANSVDSNSLLDPEDANKQFINARDAIDDNANFEFNGNALLNGSFSGKSGIETKVGTKQEYTINSVEQYNVAGSIAGGSFLATEAPKATTNVGMRQAMGMLVLKSNIVEGDTIVVNGVTFTAKKVATNLATEFALGSNNIATIRNLASTLNASTNDKVKLASYRFSNVLGQDQSQLGLVVVYNTAGTDGNSFTLSSAGANVNAATTLMQGANYASANSTPIFIQDLKGEFGDFLMTYRFEPGGMNMAKFDVRVGGQTYSTAEMILGIDGSGGIDGRGNKIAAGTELFFQKAGAQDADVGFSLKVGSDIILYGANAEAVQDEAANLSVNATLALKGLKFDINAQMTEIDDFALHNKEQFYFSGKVVEGGYLNNDFHVTDKIGTSTSSGIIKLVANPAAGESVVINGTKVTFGSDVVIGATTVNTRDNLVTFLNNSTDSKLSQAYYSMLAGTTDSLLITHKALGTSGNKFSLSTTSDNISLNNYAPFVKSVNLGDNSIDSNGTRAEFARASAEISFKGGSITNTNANVMLYFGGTATPGTGANTFNVKDGTAVYARTTAATFSPVTDPSKVQFMVGNSIDDTLQNLVDVLSKSKDANISKATYTLDSGNKKIIVTAKAYGAEGNNFVVLAGSALSTANVFTASVPSSASNGSIIAVNIGANTSTVTKAAPAMSGGYAIDVPMGGVAARGSITLNAPAANDTVTINNVVFTFVATASTTVANPVLLGSNVNEAAFNLLKKINELKAGQPAVTGVPAIPPNAQLEPLNFSMLDPATTLKNAPTILITANTPGKAGNLIPIATSAPASTTTTPAKIVVSNTTLKDGYDSFTNPITLGKDSMASIHNYPPLLKGALTNISSSFVEGTVSPNYKPNAVLFSTVVGGSTYSGEAVLSGGNFDGTAASGANYNRLGGLIAAGTKVVLKSSDSTHGIEINFSENVDLNASSRAGVESLLSSVVKKMQEGVSTVSIMQERTLNSLDESKLISTPLNGLTKSNVKIIDSVFDAGGRGGNIEQFNVDHINNIISVKINDVLYSQKLSDTVSKGGLGDSYDSANKAIKGGKEVTLVLRPQIEGDARAFKINLANVADIQISNQRQASDLASAFNNAFGSGSSGGLRFKVGKDDNAVLSINFRDMSSKAIYKDANGKVIENLNVASKEDVKVAVEVLKRTLKDFDSDLAAIASFRSRFEGIKSNLSALSNSLEKSKSTLLDADISEVTGQMVQSMMQVSTSTLARLHEMTMLKELISTLSSAMR